MAIVPAGVLRQDQIFSLIDDGELLEPRPLPDSVGNGTIDLHLSDVFLIGKRSSVSVVKAHNPAEGRQVFNEVRIRPDSEFVIQPHQFILASTLEYISLPETVAGLIQSRSSIGRMGLVAVAAAWVSPGFKGCPTLEIYNAGEVAVSVRPFRDAFCHIILFSAGGGSARPSRYQCLTKPSFALSDFRGVTSPFTSSAD